MGFIRQIGYVYLTVLRKISVALLVVLITGVLSTLIVYPLWFLSTKHTPTYNVLIAICFISVIILFLGYKSYRLLGKTGRLGVALTQIVLPTIVKIALAIIFLVLIYVVVLIFVKASPLFGVLAAIIYFVLLSFVVRLNLRKVK